MWTRCLKCNAVINPATDNRLVKVTRTLVNVEVIGKRIEVFPIGEDTKGYEHRQGNCYRNALPSRDAIPEEHENDTNGNSTES